MRATPGVSHYFAPLERTTRTSFLRKTITSQFSDLHREIFCLPARNGGIGISDPTKITEDEYLRSVEATAPLSKLILEQNIDFKRMSKASEDFSTAKQQVLKKKRASSKQELDAVTLKVDANQRQYHDVV